VRIEMDMEAHKATDELFFLMGLRSSLSREMVTSTGRIELGGLNGGQIKKASVVLPTLNLSPGVYETYYWIGSRMQEHPYDVIDNLTAPLVVKIPADGTALSTGYFKLPYKLEL